VTKVQALDNAAFEVDALAMQDDSGKQHSLLGVNKAARQQQIETGGAGALCRAPDARLQFFGPDGLARPARFACTDDDRVQFILPGDTLPCLPWPGAVRRNKGNADQFEQPGWLCGFGCSARRKPQQ